LDARVPGDYFAEWISENVKTSYVSTPLPTDDTSACFLGGSTAISNISRRLCSAVSTYYGDGQLSLSPDQKMDYTEAESQHSDIQLEYFNNRGTWDDIDEEYEVVEQEE
jgi:hypothetical protein